jgi:hypothetical protein
VIEEKLDRIRAFYRKYYDVLPNRAQDDIRAELNADEHLLENVDHLLERALSYNQDTGECVYETLQYLSKKHKENREGRLNSEAKPDFCNIKVGKSPK